jgi:two-component system chemotaxis sensor kinase CheA
MGIRSDLDANFDFEIVDEFLDHYSLMVDSMEVIILDLQKDEMKKRAVDELFRIFHNIKSASAYLQIVQMNKLASFVEDELDDMRLIDRHISQETIEWLLRISDMFNIWQSDLKDDNNITKVKYSLLKLPDLEK